MATAFDVAARIMAPDLAGLILSLKAAAPSSIDPSYTDDFAWFLGQAQTRIDALQFSTTASVSPPSPSIYDQAVLFMLLHMLTLMRRTTTATGPLTMEHVGELSRSFAPNGGKPTYLSDLGLTTWGMQLLRLAREQGIIGVTTDSNHRVTILST